MVRSWDREKVNNADNQIETIVSRGDVDMGLGPGYSGSVLSLGAQSPHCFALVPQFHRNNICRLSV